MMIDVKDMFSDEQTVSSTTTSTNYIDLNMATVTPGVADPNVRLVLLFPQLMAGTSPTLKVELKESDDNSTYTAVEGCVTSAMDGTALKTMYLPLPVKTKRYLKLAYTCGGTVSTGAKVTAFLSNSIDAQQSYTVEDGMN